MTRDAVPKIFGWFLNQQALAERADFVERVGPELTPLFAPGDRVLDLGCGAGAVAFFLEEKGAEVTGIDLTPGYVAMARDEAARRGSRATFALGDVIAGPLGDGDYDLALCLGNVVLDFPPADFHRFRDGVHRALKAGGRLVIGHQDGLLRMKSMSEPAEVVEESAAGPIRRRFVEYDPERGVYVCEYTNLTTGETVEGAGYIYTGPLIRALLAPAFDRERSVRLDALRFLDVFIRR